MNEDPNPQGARGGSIGHLILYWTVVGVPLAWGVYSTLLRVKVLFT